MPERSPASAGSLVRTLALLLVLGGSVAARSAETRVEIGSEGWTLVGDLATPSDSSPEGMALLFHKAAGDRTAFEELAAHLAKSGIASLRVDLRGHGESTGLGAFDPELSRYYDADDPDIVRNFELIRAGDRDVVAVLEWLESRGDLSGLPTVVVASSYTGEEVVEAAVETRWADLYVLLAPGSFSERSIAEIDPSGVPWLFVRAEKELPFFPELFAAIEQGSETAEVRVLPGEGHATDLFEHNPTLHLELIDWILARLPGSESDRGGAGPLR